MPQEQYMRRAIELAKKGSGRVNPNPLVGAVIVRDGVVLGEGYHECYGQLHAERNAIAHAKEAGHDLTGSTIYVTLEPCAHHGKQPPCTLALIEEGIKEVIVGSDDPNPLVSGKGYQLLREKGIKVTTHFLKEECDALNPVFFHYIKTGLPYIALKYAMTMDGKIACHTGDSKWVTGEEARAHVQKLRNHYKGIMVGIGTVLADDPMLTCRIEGGRNPVRIVADSHLRTPLSSNLVKTAGEIPVIIGCVADAPGLSEKKEKLEEAGVKVLLLPEEDGHVSIPAFLQALGKEKIDGILVEGGGTLNESILRAGAADCAYCYIAPKIFGGADAKTPVEGQGLEKAADAWMFSVQDIRMLGEDVLIRYEKKMCSR